MSPKYILPFLTYLVLVSSNTFPNLHQYPAQWIHPTYPQQFQQISPQFGMQYPNIGAGLTPNYGHQQHYVMPNYGSMYPQNIQTYPDSRYGGLIPEAINTNYRQLPGSVAYPRLQQTHPTLNDVPGQSTGNLFIYPEIHGQPHSGSIHPAIHQTPPEISVKITDAPFQSSSPEYQESDSNIIGLHRERNPERVVYPGPHQTRPRLDVTGQSSDNSLAYPDINFENRYPALGSIYPHIQTQPEYTEQSFPGLTPSVTAADVNLPNSGSKIFLPVDMRVPMIKHCPDYLKRYLENLRIEGKLNYPYSKTVDVRIIDICMPQKSGVVHFEDAETSYEDSAADVDAE